MYCRVSVSTSRPETGASLFNRILPVPTTSTVIPMMFRAFSFLAISVVALNGTSTSSVYAGDGKARSSTAAVIRTKSARLHPALQTIATRLFP